MAEQQKKEGFGVCVTTNAFVRRHLVGTLFLHDLDVIELPFAMPGTAPDKKIIGSDLLKYDEVV